MNVSADVAAHLPDVLYLPEIDLVRDALVDALTALLLEWEYRADRGVALADPVRAVKQYLAALANDRGVGKAPDEGDEALRVRALGQRACVTTAAIVAGVNAILSLATSTGCQVNDAGLDRWFTNDGTDGNGNAATWHSFLGAGPNYPDRLLSDDAANNNGASRPSSAVGGARLYNDSLGRHLLLRVPDLGFQQTDAPFVFEHQKVGLGHISDDSFTSVGIGFFVGDGTDPVRSAYLNSTITAPESIYRAIGNLMDSIVGQSVRWTMLSDLVAA